MESLINELTRLSKAQANKTMEEIFVIDIANIPNNMTAEEFAKQWQNHQDKGNLILIQR